MLLLFLFNIKLFSQKPTSASEKLVVNSVVAGVNNAVFFKEDTFFIHSGTHFLHEHFGYKLNEDSIIKLSDTIYKKISDLIILDTSTKQVVKICKQVVDFAWNKNITYSPDYINSPSTAYRTTSGRWDNCYDVNYYYNQSAVCFLIKIGQLPSNDTYVWCKGTKFTKIFEDNFEGVELNKDYWNIGYGWGRYVNGHSPAVALNKNVVVSNGTLKLNCKLEGFPPILDNDGSGPYTSITEGSTTTQTNFSSGAISTLQKYGYGKYEMRAKVPIISGVNPAYWLNSGELEIDGFEFFDDHHADQPLMTAYSTFNVGPGAAMPNCWGYQGKNKMFQAKGHQYGVWPTLPDLADGNWWNFSIVYDPNYLSWWIEDDNHTQAWSVVLYYVAQQGQVNPNPNSNCSCTGCVVQVSANYPINHGDVTFILDNEWNSTSPSNWVVQQGPPNGTVSTFEIDWIKIYVPDSCAIDVTKSSGSFLDLDYDKQNHITGNNVTLGGSGAGNPYEIKYIPWGTPNLQPYEYSPHTYCFARANDELALLDGFSVDPNALFEGSISYHLGDNNSGVASDCNLSDLNAFWPQVYRKGNSNIDSLNTNNSSINIYPNPTSEYVYVEASLPINKIEIYNSLGQLIIQTNNVKEKINLSMLNGGVYFVKVFFEKTTRISKFVKQTN